MTEQSNRDELIATIAKKYNLSKRVTELICRSPESFTADRMRDPEDVRPVRWKYFGAFAIIPGRHKKKLSN